MRILVTGAAGFIGSALCEQFMLSNHEVTAVDNFSDYYDVSLKHLRVKELLSPLSLEVLNLDICDQSKVEKIIASSNPEVVIHLAAQAGVRLGVSESRKYVDSNLVGFSNVLISTIERKVPKFLYASSSSVYGDKAEIPYSESESNLHPSSFYGSTKLANELLVPTLVKNSETVARGLRFFTVYGPWGRPDMAYFRIAAAALGQEPFTLFGDGSIKRDFTYIDDVVNSIVALFQDLTNREERFNDIINIGGGRPLEMNYLIDLISRMGDFPLVIKKSDESKLDSRITMADNTYLKSIIGKLEFTGLEQGVENLMNWAREEKIKRNLSGWIRSTF